MGPQAWGPTGRFRSRRLRRSRRRRSSGYRSPSVPGPARALAAASDPAWDTPGREASARACSPASATPARSSTHSGSVLEVADSSPSAANMARPTPRVSRRSCVRVVARVWRISRSVIVPLRRGMVGAAVLLLVGLMGVLRCRDSQPASNRHRGRRRAHPNRTYPMEDDDFTHVDR